jgi:hypothetical protein
LPFPRRIASPYRVNITSYVNFRPAERTHFARGGGSLINRCSLWRPSAAAAQPPSSARVAGQRGGSAAAVRPTAPAKAVAPARHRRAGSWGLRAAVPIPHPCAAARPPGRWHGQARANNRGLARKRYAASYARGVALCPSLTRRATAPLARPNETNLLRVAGCPWPPDSG